MMRMALALSVTQALAGCMATGPSAPSGRTQVRVLNNGQPFQMWEGAAARKAADAFCGARGVKSSLYDRYDSATGAWVYPGGCA